MSKYDRFNRLISQLRKHSGLPIVEEILQDDTPSVSSFPSAIAELKRLKQAVSAKRLAKTRTLLRSNPLGLRLSTFELMEHNFRENTHSNVLQYLFDCSLIGGIGARILTEFVSDIHGLENREELMRRIAKKGYTVEREKLVPSGRMDLFILDNRREFAIVIENKILAGIGTWEVDDGNSTTRTQLHKYAAFVNSRYKNYKKAFILLSHWDVQEATAQFHHIDYHQLYRTLLKVESTDVVLNEYRSLLYSLIHSGTSKIWLMGEARKLEKSNTTNVDLVTLEQIAGVCHGTE